MKINDYDYSDVVLHVSTKFSHLLEHGMHDEGVLVFSVHVANKATISVHVHTFERVVTSCGGGTRAVATVSISVAPEQYCLSISLCI